MEKWADYLISKVKIDTFGEIETCLLHNDNGDTVSNGIEQNRNYVQQKLQAGKTIACIHKMPNGHWKRGASLTLNARSIRGFEKLPKLTTKRKVFTSYFHADDQQMKKNFITLMKDLIVDKSVHDGDINSDSSDGYIKYLIQQGYLSDTSVVVVLIGPNTRKRKHVDWEISGALNIKIGDTYAGLLGLLLPSHPDYGTRLATYSKMPARLSDNISSGYAIIHDYTEDAQLLQKYIEDAYANRKSQSAKRINSRPQMQDDL
jgi:hypothetical protein